MNKKALAEYNNDEEDISPTEVIKYIEARSGAEFEIKTTFSVPFPNVNGIEISVKVDGNRGSRKVIAPDERFYRSVYKMTGMTFTQGQKRYHQNYKFAELEIDKYDDLVKLHY